jgi:lysozyme
MLANTDMIEKEALLERLAFWPKLNDTRQRVLCEMAFQMGFGGLSLFRKMLAAIEAEDFSTAADEMLSSLWARQTPGRAEQLARMMRTGNDDQ